MKRESGELIQRFWFRYDESARNLDGSDIVLPDALMCGRLLPALDITSSTRLPILTRLECQGLAHSVSNLRTLSIELLGIYVNRGNSRADTVLMAEMSTRKKYPNKPMTHGYPVKGGKDRKRRVWKPMPSGMLSP